MPDNGKTPLERQQDAEKANTRVTDTGERIDGEPVEGDPIPVGTGVTFEPPVGAHEVPKDEGGPDGQAPTADLLLRKASMDKQEEVDKAAAQDKADEKSTQVKDETKTSSSKTTASKTTSK